LEETKKKTSVSNLIVSSDSVEEKKRSLEEISIEIQELIDDGNDVLVEYEKVK